MSWINDVHEILEYNPHVGISDKERVIRTRNAIQRLGEEQDLEAVLLRNTLVEVRDMLEDGSLKEKGYAVALYANVENYLEAKK